MSILDWLLTFGSHYPDHAAIVLGNLCAYVFTVATERYFFPIPLDPDAQRRLKGITFVLCWLAGGTASSLLWAAFDPDDPVHVRATVSFVVSILGFFVYPAIAAVLTSKFPSIGSVWAKDPPK